MVRNKNVKVGVFGFWKNKDRFLYWDKALLKHEHNVHLEKKLPYENMAGKAGICAACNRRIYQQIIM